MIKINKNFSNIPTSLKPTYEDLFHNNVIPRTSKITHKKRLDVITKGCYINEDKYNSRYKLQDIKDALKDIYFKKCAFCEQRIEQFHVEHYRPKRKDDRDLDSYAYYWLAFSWDNLFIACPTCNTHKGTRFAVNSCRVTFNNTDENLRNINSLSVSYDDIEQPLLVNPEVTDPYGFITFTKDGKINSSDSRFQYTIKTCCLDRNDLNDQRRKLLEELKNDVRAELMGHSGDINGQKEAIFTLIRKFCRESEDKEKQFLAFRRYAIDNGWLNDLTKDVIKS